MANGKPRTPAQRMADEVVGLARGNAKVLHVVTSEEFRAIMAIAEGAATMKASTYCADNLLGISDVEGREVAPGKKAKQPVAWLEAVRDCTEKSVWIMKDLLQPVYMNDPGVVRMLRHLAQWLPRQEPSRTIVLLSPRLNACPPELSDVVVPITLDLPDRVELGAIYDAGVRGLKPTEGETDFATKQAVYEKAKESLRAENVEAAVGLSATAAILCYKKSIVAHKGAIVPSAVATEKKRIIKGAGIECYDADPRGIDDAIGGLENLKAWLRIRKLAFSEAARKYGLPRPKGIIICGIPGCGKSLTAKAVSSTWEMPLIRMDMGAMMGGIVGDTERQTQAAFKTIEAVGECVVWCDELEKMVGGAGSALDGGVGGRQFGAFLTFMNERKGGSFIIATANNVQALPSELLRKGRFDEIWAVDLPTMREREAILRVTVKKVGRESVLLDVRAIAIATKDFTGSEIAALVDDAMFAAFADGAREIRTEDLLEASKRVIPLAKTASEKIAVLRDWVKSGRARPASLPEEVATAALGGGMVDLSGMVDAPGGEN